MRGIIPCTRGTHYTAASQEKPHQGLSAYQGKAGCVSCHGLNGEGLPNLGPPLNESDWVTGDTTRLASILLHGLMGPITVSGEKYAPLAAMPGLAQNPTISDQDPADITTLRSTSLSDYGLSPSTTEYGYLYMTLEPK